MDLQVSVLARLLFALMDFYAITAISEASCTFDNNLINFIFIFSSLSQRWVAKFFGCTEFLIIKLDGFLNNLVCFLFSLEFINYHILVLKFLVILEESLNLCNEILWHFRKIIDCVDWLVMCCDSNNLIINLASVDHVHHTYDFRFDQTQRLNIDTADN